MSNFDYEETKLMMELRGQMRESFVLSALRQGEQMGLSENESLKRIIVALCDCNERVYRKELDKAMRETSPHITIATKSFYGDSGGDL